MLKWVVSSIVEAARQMGVLSSVSHARQGMFRLEHSAQHLAPYSTSIAATLVRALGRLGNSVEEIIRVRQ
jgi:hypothetical protein